MVGLGGTCLTDAWVLGMGPCMLCRAFDLPPRLATRVVGAVLDAEPRSDGEQCLLIRLSAWLGVRLVRGTLKQDRCAP